MRKRFLFFNRLSIKWKMIVILSAIMVLTSTFSLLALQLVSTIYDRQVLHLSSQMLNLYATSIENELRKLDQLTFEYFTEAVQSDLVAINYSDASYERYQAIHNLRKILLADAQSETYISSISYFDEQLSEYTMGSSIAPYDPAHIEQLLQRTENRSGFVLAPPHAQDYNFFLARKIRDIRDFSPLGTMVVRIHPEKLIRWVSSTWTDFSGRLLIFDQNGEVYYQDERFDDFDLDYGRIMNDDIHKIKDRSGHDYQLTRMYSSYTNWTYVILMSYETIFQGIIFLRTALIISLLVLSTIVLGIGISFSNKITKPIIWLSKKMSVVEKGEFDQISLTRRELVQGDEIAKLHHDFIMMIEQINHLIQENYVKQLLVKEAELKALQSQINPHFLYNTLESINWEARLNKQHKISTMVKALGDLLRRVITTSGHMTTIREELLILDAYMTIQKYRFEDRLTFVKDIDPSLVNQRIVKMSLQPVIENAIKYGVEEKSGNCLITLNIQRKDELIEIIIQDNGPGMSETLLRQVRNGEYSTKGTGIGLKNIDERIKLSFGEVYGLDIHSKEAEGTRIIMRLPYQKGEEHIA